MNNKYIQKEFGHCVNFCWANLFDNKKFLDERFTAAIGMNLMKERRMIEEITDFTTTELFNSPKNVEVYLPVFEFNKDLFQGVDPNKNYYTAYVIGIDSETFKGKIHAVLAIQQVMGDDENRVWILDPRKKESIDMYYWQINGELKPYSVTSLIKMDSHVPLLTEEDLKHLIK